MPANNLTIRQYLSELTPYKATLIAVSKTKPDALIQAFYDQVGQRDFGENKVQELVGKYERLPKDIRWHMIGHLQTNKVKYLAPFVHLIHSVDSEKLLREINKEARKNNRTIKVLLQVHIAQETEKFGFSMEEAQRLLEGNTVQELVHVNVVGLMGMATNTTDEQQINHEFAQLKAFQDTLGPRLKGPNIHLDALSIGMSGDYRIALQNGWTLIRIGTALFGSRD